MHTPRQKAVAGRLVVGLESKCTREKQNDVIKRFCNRVLFMYTYTCIQYTYVSSFVRWHGFMTVGILVLDKVHADAEYYVFLNKNKICILSIMINNHWNVFSVSSDELSSLFS